MDNLTALILIGCILLGAVTYIHYSMLQIEKEIKALWLQYVIFSGTVAEKLVELEKKNATTVDSSSQKV